ncbi:hypothetical protein [Rubinisphaera margarita]|uniref:hypothetical protein n=1 Tax=Rubinisphaera margarita TaxID=2909586 RepID=UPI001EE8D5DA|nr:hypothetical protein [Rubinisphaera margarita]MCG6154904.1 hypothetical protein [Rubinisphaera margarita]
MEEESPVFFRAGTDRERIASQLAGSFGGPMPSACWLIGGGPSLTAEVADQILQTPIPRMGINLAGTGLLRPTFWTAYDPTVRFLKSVYLDPGIMKFVHERRAMDLVPETTYKVCECPNLYFFEGDRHRGFQRFVSESHRRIVDWNDSFVQAIDILFQLGFRRIYLAGCDLHIKASAELCRMSLEKGAKLPNGKALADVTAACEKAGVSRRELIRCAPGQLYHFEQRKSFQAAVATDQHYMRVVQYLRLARRSMTMAGLELVSVTPGSRLNDYFPYRDIAEVVGDLTGLIGPLSEPTVGLYERTEPRLPALQWTMRDFRPLHWSPDGKDRPIACEQMADDEPADDEADLPLRMMDQDVRRREIQRMQRESVEINEVG